MRKNSLIAPGAITMLLALSLAPGAHAQAAATDANANAATTSDDQEIVVVGQRAAQRRGIQMQQQANNFVRGLSGDEAGKLPDGNVAESVRRLPGVSVANDQ